MKRLFAILFVLAMLLAIVPAAAFAAEQADTQEIIVLEENTSNITITCDTSIDLNGYNIDGVNVTGGTLYLLDSQTADYTVADGVYGQVTNVTGSMKAAEGYLQIGNSFHAVDLDIYAMTLRASDVGVYYKSNFAADEIVAAQVESFGVALSVVAAPTAENLDRYCGYSEFTDFEAGEGANATGTSTLLKGIMKEANGDNKNAKNAAMPIYGRAYIKTNDGYFFGETVKRSLQEQVEAIDGVWGKLTDAQKSPVLAMLETYNTVMTAWNIPNILGGEAGEGSGNVEIEVPVTAENGTVTEAVTVEQGAISITVPAGTKLAEGVTQLTLSVTEKETSEAGLTLDKSEVLMPMDVHVEGLAADNTQPLTIYLGKVMAENLNMGNYAVYHVENGKANEMVLIPVDAEFTAHNQYKYTLDGELTLYMATFSEIAVRSNTINTWQGSRDYSWYDPEATKLYIRNADQLAGFGAIVGGMDGQEQDSFSGKTVILLADIHIGDLSSENGYVFYPIGYYNDHGGFVRVAGVTVNSWFNPFAGTFDGNGNTISDFYQNTWEMFGDYNDGYGGTPNYYRDGMGLFGKVYGGTIKNLIVRNYSCDSEHGTSGTVAAYADCGATFENIAIFDCNPRVYNIANGGIVGCVGWYAKESATKKVTFKNITVDNSNTIAALWDATGTSAGGILGQYYPVSGQTSAGKPANPGVHFDSCRVSAVIEVNNDCCSNYHYYWYRYAGMLMGSVRANKVDEKTGHTMADTTGITAANCEVNYGYWNEYWYCELVKNTIASYTHDHQFGRLTSITDLSEIQDANGNWLKEGNFALLDEDRNCVDCYHIFKNSAGQLYRHYHDVADETNPNIYEDFDLNGDGQLNDLKEDRQRYYIPFGQLLTGDGMGILAHYEFEGVTVKEKDQNGILLSQEKFRASAQLRAGAYPAGANIKIGDLFAAVESPAVAVVSTNVQVTVSPADKDSTVTGTYTANTADWLSGALKFSGEGKAKVTITDYYYCKTYTLEIEISKYTADLYFEDLNKTQAYCPACDAVVTWTEIAGGDMTETVKLTRAKRHYYLGSSINFKGPSVCISAADAASWYYPTESDFACIHLNGKNITTTQNAAFSASSAMLNIMGSGTVSGYYKAGTSTTAGAAVYCNVTGFGGISLYGGTYTQNDSKTNYAVSIFGNGGKLNIYKDAKIIGKADKAIYVGAAQIRKAELYVEGATVQGSIYVAAPDKNEGASQDITSKASYAGAGKTYITLQDANITGSVTLLAPASPANGDELHVTVGGNTKIAKLTVPKAVQVTLDNLTEGTKIGVSATADVAFAVANANAAEYRNYFYATADAQIVKAVENQLTCVTPTYTDNLEFKANGKAYCVVCKSLVTWEEITATTNKLQTGSQTKSHFYLAEDVVCTDAGSGSFLNGPDSNKTACLHLNGKNLSATKQAVIFGSGGVTNVLGSGVVTGGTLGTGHATTIAVNTYTKGMIKLYSGTYTDQKFSNANTDRYVVSINSNGGWIEIYDDVTIKSVNKKAIRVGDSALRFSELVVKGAEVEGNVVIVNPVRKENGTRYTDDGYDPVNGTVYDGKVYKVNENPQYATASQTTVTLTDVNITGTVTVDFVDNRNATKDPHTNSLDLKLVGATAMSKLTLKNAATVTLGELDESVNITVTASGATNATITAADSNQRVYCKDGVIIVEPETPAEPETPTEPEEGTETEETTGA